jgi:transposase InsO family protein
MSMLGPKDSSPPSRPKILDREFYLTRSAARIAAFDFIEAWYNHWRRHSSLGQISPAMFEGRWRAERQKEEVMA